MGRGPEVPFREKVKNVDDNIFELQEQVQELEFRIKLETPPEERESRKKMDESLITLQQLRSMKLEWHTLNTIIFDLYAQLLSAPKM